MNDKKNFEHLTIGLDIGIASVGWAVLGENRIVDLGVRCFDKAETAKEGESLNLARRTARLLRRRLRRRAWRLTKLARLLKREGLINDVNILKQPPSKGFTTPNLWQLRVEALDRELTPEEWARVIYHLCKHRGFHWVSKAEKLKADGDAASETGRVKKGLAATNQLMKDKGYRTAAEMVINEFPEAQRNKQGEYSKALERELLAVEFSRLLVRQRALGNPHTSTEFAHKIMDRKEGLLWAQKPSLSGEALLAMLGKCTFEKSEYRAPKASFTAERHVWLTRLNNLRVVIDGTTRALNEAERNAALLLPYAQASDLTYKQLKSTLVKAGFWPEAVKFTGLAYPSAAQIEAGKAKDPEAATLVKLPAFQELRTTLKKAGLESEWQKISVAALDGNPQLLDQIAWVLSVYKEDDEVERELNKLDLPNKAKMVEALQTVRFDKFSNLSLKALSKIVLHMEQGFRYDEACVLASYHHSQLVKTDDTKEKYLPPFYVARDKTGKLLFNENLDIPRNPVVLRALNQARKVVNALIKKYKQSPHTVHIEMARDLSRPFDERRKIQTEQEAYRDRNAQDRATFNAEFNATGELKGRDFEKWQLYREQHGKCAYSVDPLDLNRLFEQGYAEIDHALPYSRSFDDSKNNRVLVLAAENRNKGNQTPYEYLDGKSNSERWRRFVAFVEGNKSYRIAKRNKLLKRDFGEKEAEEFRERNLNDTRYICKFFKNYVEQNLQLHEESTAKRCVVISGSLTSLLRARWGLPTSKQKREESDRHHAMDAVVVAACGHQAVKRLSTFVNKDGWAHRPEQGGYVNTETGEFLTTQEFVRKDDVYKMFPKPWKHFRSELETRLKIDDVGKLKTELANLGTYSETDLAEVKPLFVSRAPQRRNSGAAHKETIYGQTEQQAKTGSVTQKVKVTDLSIKDFGEKVDGEWVNCKLIDPHRNEKFYAVLALWVQGRDEREKRAKEIEASLGRGKEKRQPTVEEKAEIERLREPPRKPTNDDRQGPIVRTVTTVIDKLSGIPIRGGVAKNDTMLRVDVFTKAGKFHLVPVYVHHAVANVLPNRAIVGGKDESEWTPIDDTFAFCFALYPNDYVRIHLKGEVREGYYAGCDRFTAAINLWIHDRNVAIGKEGLIRGVGVKTALSIEKFNVDVLGNIYPAAKEERRGLA